MDENDNIKTEMPPVPPTFQNKRQEEEDTLWLYVYRYSRQGPRTLWHQQSNKYFEELTQTLCERMIRNEMNRLSLDHSPIKTPKLTVTLPFDVQHSIEQLQQVLMQMNPGMYADLTQKLSLPLLDERNMCRMYCSFGENLFAKGISWPLVVSFILFSGKLAAECMRSGRSILVRHLCDWATLFSVLKLKAWITENGGWKGIVAYLERTPDQGAERLKQASRSLKIPHKILKDNVYIIIAIATAILMVSLLTTFQTSTSTAECPAKDSLKRGA